MAHVVFVGLGFGGLYTLRRFLDNAPADARVTAIDRRDRFVFTPLLYEYIAGELEPDVVAAPLAELVERPRVELLRAEVERVDVERRRLRLSGGRALDFDLLVLAPGAVPAFHDVPGAEKHGRPFYSFDDAERLVRSLELKSWAGGGLPACVVGGGPVGVELACALAEVPGAGAATGPRVVLLETLPDILRAMSAGMRKRARSKLEGLGVEVRTGVRVEEVAEDGIAFRGPGGTRRLEAAVVAWTAGIRLNPLVEALPGGTERTGVRVEATLQLPGHPHVFVLGDAISHAGHADGELPPDTAQAAVQQSEICAANLWDALRGAEPKGRYRFRSLGEFLRVGRGQAIADVKGIVLDGGAAALARRAAYLARFPAWALRLAAVRQWLG